MMGTPDRKRLLAAPMLKTMAFIDVLCPGENDVEAGAHAMLLTAICGLVSEAGVPSNPDWEKSLYEEVVTWLDGKVSEWKTQHGQRPEPTP
jgi:hypothetical protein